MAAGIVILLPPFPVNACDERWQTAPIALLVAAALLVILVVRFTALRFALGTCALLLAGYAAFVLYLGSALGCD
jgi:hypothetical protein